MRSNSSCTVEKVVRAPHRPVPSSGRRSVEIGRRSCKRVTRYPKSSAPKMLTVKVAHGQLETLLGSTWLTATLASDPSAPPQTIAPSSARSTMCGTLSAERDSARDVAATVTPPHEAPELKLRHVAQEGICELALSVQLGDGVLAFADAPQQGAQAWLDAK